MPYLRVRARFRFGEVWARTARRSCCGKPVDLLFAPRGGPRHRPLACASQRAFTSCGGFHMRSDMVPGAVFPDYELSDHTAKRRKLSELQGPDPMILVLGRGGYCPKDRRQHEGLVQLHRELEIGYRCLVTMTTDSIA